MPENCDVIAIFQFTANLEQSGSHEYIVCRIYIFINSNLLSYKNWKQN